MSEKLSPQDWVNLQDRADLYFKQKALPLLPDASTYSDGLFQGYRIQFAKRKIEYKKGGEIKFHGDPVAAILVTVVVKFSRHKPNDEEKLNGVKPRWEHKVTVYGKKDNLPEAIMVMDNPPKPKEGIVNLGGRPRKEPIIPEEVKEEVVEPEPTEELETVKEAVPAEIPGPIEVPESTEE